MTQGRRPRGFLLISLTLLLMLVFILMFSLMTLAEQRTRLVKTNSDRTVLSAEARAGLAEAAHYLSELADWSQAATGIPSAEASLNSETGAWRKVQVISADSAEIRVRSLGYLFDNLEMLSNSTLHVSNGPAVVYFREGLNFLSNVELNYQEGAIEDSWQLQFYGDSSSAGAKTVTLNSNVVFVGLLCNPSGPVVVESNAQVYGGLVGSTVELRSNATAHFDKRLTSVQLSTEPGSKPEIRSYESW